MSKTSFSLEEATQIGEQLGINWSDSPFSVEQFQKALEVELEHGTADPATNVTNDDPLMTGKIALAHFKESADYYDYLERMEAELEGQFAV